MVFTNDVESNDIFMISLDQYGHKFRYWPEAAPQISENRFT
jgi:hypothetical protein